MNIRTEPVRLPAHGVAFAGLEPPIRSAFLREDELGKLGRALAQRRADLVASVPEFDVRRRATQNGSTIAAVVRSSEKARQKGESITPATAWIIDNHYVIEDATLQIRRDLPRKFWRQLPLLMPDSPLAVPRVLAIAWNYVAHSDSQVTEAGFEAIVEGYQSVEPLTIGELWALPSVLRFVLVENLRRLALRIARAREMRRSANDIADLVHKSPSEEEELRILTRHSAKAADMTFATQLLFRLRDGSRSEQRALAWLESELEKAGSNADRITTAEHARLSSGNVTTGNIVRSLKRINDIDWTLWFERISKIDALLREKTDFEELDFASRNQYRDEIEELAKRSEKGEFEVAAAAIEKCRRESAVADSGNVDIGKVDVGSVLVGPKRREFEREIGYLAPFSLSFKRVYSSTGWLGIAAPVAMLTAMLMAIAGFALEWAGEEARNIVLLLGLFLLPASEAAVGVFNTLATLVTKPSRLVGYDYKSGIPAEARTLFAMPTLIGSRDDVEDAIHNLEVHYLANAGGELWFALVTDWLDSNVEQSEADMELLELARKRIAALNQRYPAEPYARFHILHRRRLFNPNEGVWMGWERKRGKLLELNALLRGDLDTTFFAHVDPLPEGIRYVMTVDADTRTTRDAVRRLVGKMQHPLNRAVVDPVRRLVTAGYGILQPRVTSSLTSGDEASFFQRVFSANRGMDPYVFAVSDVYQDVFGSGTFTGKGLYDIDALDASLDGRIPENAVLSHDLLEGAFASAGLASDVELVEDYPTRYSVDASRHHRWARGDWQLLPFILNPLSAVPGLSRWKMIDNLRRSLTPIFWVMAAATGWTVLPLPQAALWQLCLIVCLVFPATFDIVQSLLQRQKETSLRSHLTAFARDFFFATLQVAVRMVLIAHSAWLMGDAIVRTLFRLLVSRKHMLEWRAASQAAKARDFGLIASYRSMYGAVVVAVFALVLPLAAGSTGAWIGSVFAAMWLLSPAIAWLASRPAETEEHLEIKGEDATVLRTAARRTWHYFETFVTADHHDLPPDNFQEKPTHIVAPRTSPTNIGAYLLSTVSARDFGWIGLSESVDRIERTLSTMERMDRYRGHLFNWYTTNDLAPMRPRYISAVDSGNLAGHLIAVSAACRQWAQAPAVHLQGDFTGILDVNVIVEETLQSLPDDRRSLRPLRQRLFDRLKGMQRAVDTIRGEPETAAIRTINLSIVATDIRKLAVALDEEIGSEISRELAIWAGLLERTCKAHIDDAHTGESGVTTLRSRLLDLSTRARKFAFEMDFSFLLRKDRNLLSIGWRVEEEQLDEACYDLLASEARLTSLFGIAKGDLPTDHWFRLGRPVTEIGFRGALVSWSGSMFEYLMPPLVMKEPLGGILNQTSNLIIRKQISYARGRGVPWGISEAAYNARDREMTYQYTNFGVPGLGLKRGLAQNLVIAPYATLLAAQFKPKEAIANLRRLRAAGALGRYGYHDAVDYTPERVPDGQICAVVKNYYAHHQGMSIVAVANAIFEGRMRDRFHSDQVIESAELLLQEKAPRQVLATSIAEELPGGSVSDEPGVSGELRIIRDPASAPRATNLLSNGRYSVMLTAMGTGYSRTADLAVTRWNADPSEDRAGTFIFVQDADSREWWSATSAPKSAQEEQAQAIFADDKATFLKSVGTLRTEVECIVSAEAEGEARRITIFNTGLQARRIDITSFAEIVLGDDAADAAHPLFSKMFVKTEIGADGRRIVAQRRRRNPDEASPALAHFVVGGAGAARDAEAETDRRAFIGRGRSIEDAAAFDADAKLSGTAGYVLDPIAAIRCRVRVPAGKKVTLTFWTLTAPTREEVLELAERFDHPESFNRQAMLAWTRSQVQTRHCGLSLSEASRVQRLGRYLLYPEPWLRAPSDTIAATLGQQSSLWPLAISGDFPIFALRIGDVVDLEIVADALRMHEYLRTRGLMADFVVINEQASSYVQDLQQAIESLCDNARMRNKEHGPRQHIFAVRRDLMSDETYRTLLAAARITMHARNGIIGTQIDRAEAAESDARRQQTTVSLPALRTPPMADAVAPEQAPLEFWNGYGGFENAGRDYVVRLEGTRTTPQPWINVIANGDFGFHVSAEGASYTWSRNSRDFQLTPWTNDPVTNRPGEAFYVHDMGTGAVFSPIAAVARNPQAHYEARHSAGVSQFAATHGAVRCELVQLVDPKDAVKVSALTLVNTGGSPVRLRVYGYAEWVLGNNRTRTAPYIVSACDAAAGMLTARNPYSLDYSDRVAFFATDGGEATFTADRGEFLGRGTVLAPEAVRGGRALSGWASAGRDACAAIARDVELAPGASVTMTFLLGDAGSQEEAAALVVQHAGKPIEQRLAENASAWDAFASTLSVRTADPAFDHLVNRWLPYQAYACRIKARSAFYQASGAFGFRDQLQDTLALMLHAPELARGQILNAAGRQFIEGDVQHWWLPRTGAGVRTIIADDVVWLAYAANRYVEVTGDRAILGENIPFIEGRKLEAHEHDAFYQPETSSEVASLYEHCARGLDLAIRRTGKSGLPLFLGGDWNDGMNRVGEGGKGESVWLGWFLLKALTDFIPIAADQGDDVRVGHWRRHAERLRTALATTAWDGQWFKRGSFDDGTPLGSASSEECRIDSIAQSWAVLSGQADPSRAATAVSKAVSLLVDEQIGVAKLFTPPFEHTTRDPGYIRAYPPGVRENGGQYTHAATWLVLALAELDRADDAYRLFSMLNPINHSLDAESAERYRVEPYVVAADVYAGPGRDGRGGWTWYTGSAGWLYRAAVEGILGIEKRGNTLAVNPRLPSSWSGFSAELRLGSAVYRIAVTRGEARRVCLDGQVLDGEIPLSDGEHALEITVSDGAAT